jgi:nicotinate phosphoribosyltransferase
VVQFERDGRTVPIAKLSEGKATYPGPHQVHRYFDDGVTPTWDVLALADESVPPDAVGLLRPRLLDGRAVGTAPTLEASRTHAIAQLDALPAVLHELAPSEEPHYEVRLSPGLEALVSQVKATLEDTAS